jgi:hypothetical protein
MEQESELEHKLSSKLKEDKLMNHALTYQPSYYVVWPIIAIHGHQCYNKNI